MRLWLGWWLVLVVVGVPVALLSCAEDDDPVPPRQDGWIIYHHPAGGLYDETYGVVIDALGGKWIGANGATSYLDDNGTTLDLSDDTWMSYTTLDGPCGVAYVHIDASGGKWLRCSEGVIYFDDNGTPLDKTDDTRTSLHYS